jgi:hypothetical protein
MPLQAVGYWLLAKYRKAKCDKSKIPEVKAPGILACPANVPSSEEWPQHRQ